MLQNEIFDTKNLVTWQDTSEGAIGTFQVDDELYYIDLEEYEIKLASGLKTVADVGFRKGKSSELTGDQKPGRVMGSVVNGLRAKLSSLKSDIVMFGALTKNGAVEQRKVIYRKVASLLTKVTPYKHLSPWHRFTGGEYAFMANFEPSEADDELLKALIAKS